LAAAELKPGAPHPALVNRRRILLCRIDDDVFALADLCPHARQPLAGGRLEGRTIRCPLHGACFDVSDGRPLNTVTKLPVATFPVRERNGRIEVKVPAPAGGFMPNFAQSTP